MAKQSQAPILSLLAESGATMGSAASIPTTADKSMPACLRIAMWSGPRNLSTALMRSFSSRPDTTVLDEPFYAHYLRETGIAHPGRELVMAAQENDWQKV